MSHTSTVITPDVPAVRESHLCPYAGRAGWGCCQCQVGASVREVVCMVINEAVSGLLLDERNPRFPEQVSGQDEAVTAILVDAAPKLVNLAQDIANEGSLNPTELPVVVEEEGELVVVEGNRRLAALKLLRNPDLATAASQELGIELVKRFKALQQVGTGPDSIDVYQADSREAARHWIELRHTGENDGVGVLGWQAWQTNNYRRRRGSQADRATLFCQAVETDFAGNASLLGNVAAVRRERLTTLGRLVADPDVRRDFGFLFDGDEVLFDYESDDLRPGFSRIFDDLSSRPGVTVTDIKSKAQRQAYISDRSEVLPDRARKLSEPRRPGEHPSPPEGETGGGADAGGAGSGSHGGGSGSGGETAAGGTSNGSDNSGAEGTGGGDGKRGRTPPPENVIFKSLRLPHLHVRVRDLLSMAQRININDAAPICGILIRVIVELVVTEAIQCGAVTGAVEGDKLKKKVRQALLAVDPDCANPTKRDKSLEMAWTRTQDGDALAVQSLNAFVHNVHGQAAPTEVRSLSLTFRPLLEQLDQLIASHKK